MPETPTTTPTRCPKSNWRTASAMKLCELEIRGLRVPDRTYSFRGPNGAPQSLVLITAPPAFGKTSLLRAIAAAKEGFAAYGPPVDFAGLLRPGATEGLLAADWLLTAEEVKAAGLSAKQQHTEVVFGAGKLERKGEQGLRELWMKTSTEPGVGKMELFPEGRRLGKERWRQRQPPLSGPIEEGKRLSAEPDKYVALARVLHDLALERSEREAGPGRGDADDGTHGPPGFGRFSQAIEQMTDSLRLGSVRLREGTVGVQFTRPDGSSVGIEHLSAGEEQAILFALMHGWRGLNDSILLIDSPELGVHGAHHADMLARLRHLGSDNQILAATSSEALLRRAQPAEVIDVSGGDSRAIIEAARAESMPRAVASPVAVERPDARMSASAAPSSDPGDDGDPYGVSAPKLASAAVAPAFPAVEPPAVVSGTASAHAARRASSPFGASHENGGGGSAFGPVAPMPVVPVLRTPARPLEPSPWTRPAAEAEGDGPKPLAARHEGVPPAEARAPSGAGAVPPPPVGQPAPGIDQTGELNLEAVVAGKRALPFAGSGPPPASAVPDSARKGFGPGPSEPGARSGKARPGVDETQEWTVDAIRDVKKALPFDKEAGADSAPAVGDPSSEASGQAPKLTLEQYASLRAELEVTPAEVERIERSYGIRSAAERDALKADWAVELATKPAQMKKFEELRKSYAAWLREQKR
jgi:hypothetical protein